jgi:hypothetical protein
METTDATGAELIARERQRQVDDENWDADHDDQHTRGSLALAAVCYAAPVPIFFQQKLTCGVAFREPWPWDTRWDKRRHYGSSRDAPGSLPDPKTFSDSERMDLLVKAGALIAAEIDRLQRKGVSLPDRIEETPPELLDGTVGVSDEEDDDEA